MYSVLKLQNLTLIIPMPDRRQHRGPHPKDEALFAPSQWPDLRAAIADMRWLFDKGYGENAVIKLVGDRYRLRERQRRALQRSCCTTAQAAERRARQVAFDQLGPEGVAIDGFNLLILLESALSGAFLFRGLDGCLRDLAGIHGSYRLVEETRASLHLLAQAIPSLPCHWLLDRPVSNSGRLKTLLYETAEAHELPWTVDLADSPDHVLVAERVRPVVSSDRFVLDQAERWCNLGAHLVEKFAPEARVVELSKP